MPSRSSFIIDSYSNIAKFFHWTIAVLIITNYVLGITLDETQFKYMAIHKQIGLTILFLVLLRIIYHMFAQYPNMANELSVFEKFAAKSGHYVLYILMLSIPIAGILLTQSSGRVLQYLGVFNIPAIISPKSDETVHLIGEFHKYLAHAIIIAASGHAFFALMHHFVKKDSVLLRMIPRFKKRDNI